MVTLPNINTSLRNKRKSVFETNKDYGLPSFTKEETESTLSKATSQTNFAKISSGIRERSISDQYGFMPNRFMKETLSRNSSLPSFKVVKKPQPT